MEKNNENLVFEYTVLTEEIEKLSNEFNALPKKEREEGSFRAKKLLITLSALSEKAITMAQELAMRIKDNPEKFNELMNSIPETSTIQ